MDAVEEETGDPWSQGQAPQRGGPGRAKIDSKNFSRHARRCESQRQGRMSTKVVLKPGQVERGPNIKLQPRVSGARSCGRRTSVDPGQVERTQPSSCKQAANVATVGSTSHAHATGCDTP